MKGQYFPELEYGAGDGTILFFYLENTEYLQIEDDAFGEVENLELLISQTRVELNMLKVKYPFLRIFMIDVYKKRELTQQHQVTAVPVLLLYDRMGYEVGRWLPGDFQLGGVISREVESLVERIKNPLRKQVEEDLNETK